MTFIHKTKFFTSNRPDALEKKVNEFLETIPGIAVEIEHDVSMSEKRGYILSCMVHYTEEKGDDICEPLDFNIDFGIGDPIVGDPVVID